LLVVATDVLDPVVHEQCRRLNSINAENSLYWRGRSVGAPQGRARHDGAQQNLPQIRSRPGNNDLHD
jgi:hypothetical protein